ncbi:ABC transporter permease [Saccharothrix variisporea]|uniref:ABC-2 type transport system permease protein n=1 Tax=Saccharothrix variisporea TaxID=543527 RepID=A0A495XGI4_9PSEU|nr:ABC transporter permease subunit [Saccharothrix variisporea]RKT70678.1 ABC-2 type transport system permease protein [Saccharothrix variisporea]
MTATSLSVTTLEPVRAPLARQLRSELRWIIRRPRTVIGLFGLCLVPVLAGIGLWFAVDDGDASGGPGLAAIIGGNGLVLPVFTLFLALPLLLPLVGAIWAADGLAGEAQHGTLRGLLIAPVGRMRLLAVKSFGVATMTLFAITLMAFVAVITGAVLFGGSGMLTLSGTTLPFGAALGRIALTILLVTVQVWGVAAIAMAISACTEHPLVVMAATMAGVIVFAVLGLFEALDWLHPYLITTYWNNLIDVMRDPLPTEALWRSTALAGCYILIGLSLAAMRLATRDN